MNGAPTLLLWQVQQVVVISWSKLQLKKVEFFPIMFDCNQLIPL